MKWLESGVEVLQSLTCGGHMMTKGRTASILLVFTTLFWALNFTLGRAVAQVFPPVTLTFVRWLMAAGILYPFVRRQLGGYRKLLRREIPSLMALGITGIMGFSVLVYTSLRFTTVINSTLLNSLGPAVVATFSFLVYKDRLTAGQWAGIGVSLLGAFMIIFRGSLAVVTSLQPNIGDLLMFVAILLWGVYSMVLKRAGALFPVRVLFFSSICAGLVLVFPVMLLENWLVFGTGWLFTLETVHFLSLLYFGFFPTVLSFLFYNQALLMIGPSRAAVYLNLVVVFAAVFAITLLGERLYWYHPAGALLIIGGIYWTSYRNPENAIRRCQ